MAARISLALTLHNHQPIGNFGWVIAEVYDQAYRPMLEALDRHPGVRVALHYSGPLLEWLEAERPEFLLDLRRLVARGQVELLGGGLYEPILVSLPTVDRVEQLERMAARVTALTGIRTRGAWLAERVWEPSLPTAIAAAGYDWTILDDTHFRAASLPDDALWGAYVTEDQGVPLRVFGTEQGLRYRIPFGDVDDVIDHLRRNATDDGERLGTMGDDGEKFGAWPTTFEHCWGSGRWVEKFFAALEANRDWLTTVTPSDWLDRHPPLGRVYLPTGSYVEMSEWALPADEALAFAAALRAAREAGRPEARWLGGASWRNFLVKYREGNDLHKQMLRASTAVHAMSAGPARDAALDHLHRGQSNDCYWHGLFGGIYLSDLRLAALGHLIAAQAAADTAAGQLSVATLVDLDLDGRDEALLANAGQVLTVDIDEGAGIGSWDLRAAHHAVTAVLRRRPEAYHAALRTFDLATPGGATADGPTADDYGPEADHDVRDPGAPASIHDLLVAKESNLASRLQYDDHERRSGLVRLLPVDATPDESAAGTIAELGDFVSGPFRVVALETDRLVVARAGQMNDGDGPRAIHVEKTLRLGGDRLSPTLDLELAVENRSAASIRLRIALEFSTNFLGGGGNPAAWWEMAGRRAGHDSAGAAPGVTTFAQGNDHVGVAISTTVEPPADAWWSPIETVSNSESGFERAYQGSCLLLSWPRQLAPGERFMARISHVVATGRA